MVHRVVITATGIISSLGNDPTAILADFRSGRAVFKRPECHPEVAVSPIESFDLRTHSGRFKYFRYLNRGAQFAAAAAKDAVSAADLSAAQCAETGLFVGCGPNFALTEAPEIGSDSVASRHAARLWMLRFLPNTAAATIAGLCGLHAENATIGTACSASLQAIGEAFRRIKDGYLETAVAGGGDSRIHAGGIRAYADAGALAAGNGDPGEMGRPFDERRMGFVPGEGGAFLVLESLTHARKRGAEPLAEVLGYGLSMDGHALTAPEPSGVYAEKAVNRALREAMISPDQVDVVSAHGTGTLLNDAMEADLIARIYEPHRPHVVAFKSWIGHLAAACGAIETVLMLVCLQHNLLPAIRNLTVPCRPGVDFVRQTRTSTLNTAIIQNFGFGGQNCALVLQKITS